MTSGSRPVAGAWARRRGLAAAAGLTALVGASLLVRLGGRGFSLWVDEGLSVGIASHPVAEIPALLARDGSPPLYYVLLHGWMALFGSSSTALRALSLVVALAGIPLAWWAGRRLFGQRAGWVAAVLMAFSSYLTVHSREARMYTLVVVVGLAAVAAFLQVLVLRRRHLLAVLVVALAALAYTHHWGLFLIAGLAAAVPVAVRAATAPVERRAVVRDAAVAFGIAAVLYAPWVPILVAQVGETGAPWSRTPTGGDLWRAVHSVLGSAWVTLVLAVAVAALVLRIVRHDPQPPDRSGSRTVANTTTFDYQNDRVMAAALGVVLLITMGTSWLASQIEPAWSSRYFGAYLPPLVLLGALALARAGGLGVAGLAVMVALWTVPSFGAWESPSAAVPKSNVAALAQRLEPVLQPGDVVFSSQLEQVPLLRHELGSTLRYADPTGVVDEPTVADWRHALDRMVAARPAQVLAPLVAGLEPGGHVVLACPRLFTDEDDALWYRLMDRHCASAKAALAAAPGMERVWGPVPPPTVEETGAAMAVTLYRRVSGAAR